MFAILLSQAAFSAPENLKATGEYVPGQLIVKYKDSVAKSAMRPMNAITKKVFRASEAELLEFDQYIDLKKMVSALKSNPNIEYVEYNSIYRLSVVPDDTNYSDLYGMEKISAPLAWEQTRGSKQIVVGVIDTGIDYNHPDLAANMWANPGETGLDDDGEDKTTNGIDDDGNGYIDDHRGWDFINGDNDPMDGNDHGSHCAGTIGAVGNNDLGVVGVNWDVSLVGLKIFSDAGSTTVDAIVEAIEYSTLIGVDVTNNSWGGGAASVPIKKAISEANDNGIMFVAAAGNSGANNDTGTFFPANYELENIISVAATDSKDGLARFSNYGATRVHVGAPGVGIYSTRPNGRYQNLSGTSMAAPHVTGLVALVKSQFPKASIAELKNRIVYLGDEVESLNRKSISGKRINAFASLEIDEIAPAAVENLVQEKSSIASVTVSFSKTGDDGRDGEAVYYEIRTSLDPIDERNWDAAKKVKTKSVVSTDEETLKFRILELPRNFEGFAAVKAMDSTNNFSQVSESIEIKTIKTQVFYENELNVLDDFTLEGAWGLETAVEGEEEKSYLSDSPKGDYESNVNASATLKSLDAPKGFALLMFKTKFDLENRFDKVFVEVSLDGSEDWNELIVLNGKKDWHTVSVNLSESLTDASTYQIRFRMTSDGTAVRDGILIDNIAVLTEASKAE